jgi:hypothetical protein
MQRPGFREAEIEDHRDNENRRPEDREKNDCHNRDCYPWNVRVMPENVVISRDIQVFSDLLFNPALKIVTRRTARRRDGSRSSESIRGW